MPTITFTKEALFSALKKRLSDAALKDRVSMFGTPVEELTKEELTIEVFPNRPDLLSLPGFARSFSAFLGLQKGLRTYDVEPSGYEVVVEESVATCRPRTACALVRGLSFTDEKIKELIQLQEKLHVTFGRNRKKLAIGIYPAEKITFPVFFRGLAWDEIVFRPLEADREMTAREILTRHPKGREYAHLVEGLDRLACFVDAKGEIMSLTPIINSHLTGKVTEATTTVFVECSGFDQRVLNQCLNMIVTALAEMGGVIQSVTLRTPDASFLSPDLAPARLVVEREYVNKILGLDLDEKQFRDALERAGFGYEEGDVLVPPYRADILHPIDVVEDVAIAYGYERIGEVLPSVATIGQEEPLATFVGKLRTLMVGHGLLECKNFHLIKSSLQRAMMGSTAKVVRVTHPVSQEYDALRTALLPSLLETLQRNKHHEYPQRLFETGRVFSLEQNRRVKSETGVAEEEHLAVAFCEERADYTKIRQLLDDLWEKLGLEVTYEATTHPSFLPGRTARVLLGKKVLAYLGELHPRVLESFELVVPVAACEVNLSVVYEEL